jgi:nicotinamide-nucleotide amidase
MPETNVRQAMIPAGADLLPNPVGTAPGLWLEVGGRALVLLPGPPRELHPIFDAHVAPRLSGRAGPRRLRRRVLRLTGLSESAADEIAQPVYAGFASEPIPVRTTILASPGQIELHLSAADADAGALDAALDSAGRRLADALRAHVVSVDGRTLEEVVGQLLAERSMRIAFAESCTGGLALGRLTDVPGSSAWVIGGVVAYDNAVKVEQLGVPPALIDAHGAVSEPVGAAMAGGVRRRLGADVGVAITGIAGPSGGTVEKPVGTVVIAIDGSSSRVRTFSFPGDRAMVRVQSVVAALNMVREALTAR